MTAPLLETRAVSVAFGGVRAVDNISIALPQGEIRGLIGPNGAGKTTLFNAIIGLAETSGGSVVFAGQDVSHLSTHLRARLGMRRTFQSVQLVPQFSVLENVLVGLHCEIDDPPLRRIFGFPKANRAEFAGQDRVIEILRFLGIESALFRRTDQLTFVEQRFVEIARAIVSGPALLMLDEPAAGLSPQDIETLDALLRRLRDERGLTILLIEHVLSLVMAISDRVSVLDNGRLVCEGTPEQVMRDPGVQLAYLGVDDA